MSGGNTNPPRSQAEAIIRRFGGPRDLARALAAVGAPRDPSAIYRWTYPRDQGGTGGLIPTSAVKDVKRAARFAGIELRPEDWDPPIEDESYLTPGWRND